MTSKNSLPPSHRHPRDSSGATDLRAELDLQSRLKLADSRVSLPEISIVGVEQRIKQRRQRRRFARLALTAAAVVMAGVYLNHVNLNHVNLNHVNLNHVNLNQQNLNRQNPSLVESTAGNAKDAKKAATASQQKSEAVEVATTSNEWITDFDQSHAMDVALELELWAKERELARVTQKQKQARREYYAAIRHNAEIGYLLKASATDNLSQ